MPKQFLGVRISGATGLLWAVVLLSALGLGTSPKAFAQEMILPGKFNVLPTGAASFSIPVSVPPGTGGMVPALSLDYSSGGANGLLGVGWSLGGLLAITRCAQTVAQNGTHGSVTYDVNVGAGQADTDRFCLNGQQLIAINGGVYGADGTQYRTELEGFSEIISHGRTGNSPTWFEVHTKSGQIMEFGNTPDSRVMLAGIASVRTWLVDRIADTTGNYLTVSYNVNPGGISGNSEVEPSQILYTGNSNTGLQPYNKVTFSYATRPDITPLYTGGALSEMTQRLTDIETWAGSTPVSNYELTYQTSGTGRSLLSSIQLCDGSGTSGTCLPARTFGWQAGGGGVLGNVITTTGPNFGAPPDTNWTLVEGDFNGDGRDDFAFIGGSTIDVLLSNGNGTFTTKTQNIGFNIGAPPGPGPFGVFTGDFNGDGRTDFIYVPYPSVFIHNTINGPIYIVTHNIFTFLSNGDGTFTMKSQSWGTSGLNTVPSGGSKLISGDFTGNGRTDFAYVYGNTIDSYLSNGDGTFSQVASTVGSNFGTPPDNWTPISGDFTGNGETDFAMVSGNTIVTLLSNGDGTFTSKTQTIGPNFGTPPTANWTPIEGDFNGDGLLDFAMVSGSTIETFLSKGDGTFANTEQTTAVNFGAPPANHWTPIEGDFNGDGKTDFAFILGNTSNMFISNGDGTFTRQQQTIGGNYSTPPTDNWQPVMGNFTGSGLGDFAFVSGTTINTYLANGSTPDLLTSIGNGIGATTTISYGTPALGWGSYYAGWTNSVCSAHPASYPIIDISFPTPVVTSTASSTGLASGGTYDSTFGYACGRMDLSGRGFLGFTQETVTDPQTGIVQTSNFLQNFPYIGLISSETKTLGSTVLNSTTNSYATLTGSSSPALPWSGTQFPYLAQSVSASNDLNGAALPTITTTYSYDSYGDALTVATSKSLGSTQGSSQTTTNTYQAPNTSTWILGRLVKSVVVSTTP
ncbi:FG-GAP-like repeat-containing protein [Acidiphilium iwatense]|uniref:FG-GAP-like repeat-containing protein n=1 Tax=Acidiphilium iwatense TaxID=768198 RepID=A0ABS9DSU4_9PROT|nr:FG-GAP-like repeat-containing protein [Acidiphilium iwatense]MCF3945757.1 FG-GAP-like repeat-containing protein [Acidiphilium iwatense]